MNDQDSSWGPDRKRAALSVTLDNWITSARPPITEEVHPRASKIVHSEPKKWQAVRGLIRREL